jgi:hypothetical protein
MVSDESVPAFFSQLIQNCRANVSQKQEFLKALTKSDFVAIKPAEWV